MRWLILCTGRDVLGNVAVFFHSGWTILIVISVQNGLLHYAGLRRCVGRAGWLVWSGHRRRAEWAGGFELW